MNRNEEGCCSAAPLFVSKLQGDSQLILVVNAFSDRVSSLAIAQIFDQLERKGYGRP